MHVSRRVGLRLEQRIEVPERRLNEPISGHLVEAHLEQSLSKLGTNFQKRMQVATVRHLTSSVQVCLFELSIFPCSSSKHICGQLCFQLNSRRLIVAALGDLITLESCNIQKLTLFKLSQHFFIMLISILNLKICRKLRFVLIVQSFRNSRNTDLVCLQLDPLILHSLRKTNFSYKVAYFCIDLYFRCCHIKLKS